jgi:hypothetical protein
MSELYQISLDELLKGDKAMMDKIENDIEKEEKNILDLEDKIEFLQENLSTLREEYEKAQKELEVKEFFKKEINELREQILNKKSELLAFRIKLEELKKENQKSLNDLKSGKCKPTHTRAIKNLNNYTCYIDFARSKFNNEVYVENQGIILNNNTILNVNKRNHCIEQLSKEIQKKQSVTELHNLNHPTRIINIIPFTTINNTILSPYYNCKYVSEELSNFNPFNKISSLDFNDVDYKKYQKGYHAITLGLCEQKYTQAEYSSRYYSCNISYDKNGKIIDYFHFGDGNHREDLDNCYTQLFNDIKQEVPNIHGESEWAKYGIPQTPSKLDIKKKVKTETIQKVPTAKSIPNNSTPKTTTPVKVNMPQAPIYK